MKKETSEKLFGTDGIRGIAGEFPLTKDFIKHLGFTSTNIIKEKEKKDFIIIGRDTRKSSDWIFKSLARGIRASGTDVWDAGVISTPAVSYLTKNCGALAGCVISASHNPAEFNGIKFFSPNGTKISDLLERKIEKEVGCSRTKFENKKKKGKIYRDNNLVDKYKSFLKKVAVGDLSGGVTFDRLKLVVDCANGSNYKIAPDIFKELGADVYKIGTSPNGENINLNCGSLHIQELAKEVVRKNADIGIAFDGDGDRCILCDEKGNILDGDYIIAICASFLKVDKVVVTVMSNFGLYKALKEKNIRVITTNVGDRFVQQEMKKSNAVIGGEQSGHIIFSEHINTGDGIVTAIKVLSIMKRTGKKLSQLATAMQRYPQVLLNVNVSKKRPIEKNRNLYYTIKEAEKKLGDTGRILVRYSGTEPLLRIMVEGQDKKTINQLAKSIAQKVNF